MLSQLRLPRLRRAVLGRRVGDVRQFELRAVRLVVEPVARWVQLRRWRAPLRKKYALRTSSQFLIDVLDIILLLNGAELVLLCLEVAGPPCRLQVELAVLAEFLWLQTAQLLVLVVQLLVQFRQVERLQLGRRLECGLSSQHEVVLLVAVDLELLLGELALALPGVLLLLVHRRLVLAEELIIQFTIVSEQLPGLGPQVRQSGNRLLWTLSWLLFDHAVVRGNLPGRPFIILQAQLLLHVFECSCDLSPR